MHYKYCQEVREVSIRIISVIFADDSINLLLEPTSVDFLNRPGLSKKGHTRGLVVQLLH